MDYEPLYTSSVWPPDRGRPAGLGRELSLKCVLKEQMAERKPLGRRAGADF